MSDPREVANTKIERVAEAIENIGAEVSDGTREELRSALRDFLQPMLTLVSLGPTQGQTDATMVKKDRTCAKCKKTVRCKPNCPDWHGSIRQRIEGADDCA